MALIKDIEATKLVKKEISRRFNTLPYADIRVFNGIAYVHINPRHLRLPIESIREVSFGIKKILKSKNMVKDVVLEGGLKN